MGTLARKTGKAALGYRQGYLRSPGWKKWRREYFESVRARGWSPRARVAWPVRIRPRPGWICIT